MTRRSGRQMPMRWAFSAKQRFLMSWWELPGWSAHDGVIAYGSVRSGKTIGMTIGFILWAMRSFNGCAFAICGKTIGSVRRNVVAPLLSFGSSIQCRIIERKAENKLEIAGYGTANTFYIFGGNDDSSQDLIQGVTLAGCYFDEVALQNQAFVNQAIARCSVDGSKFWFNCNPESPMHWFKTDFVDKAKSRNLIVLHFVMDDNLSLAPAIRDRYKRSFVGVFYQRYILGNWAISEGLVYPEFSLEENVVKEGKASLFNDKGVFDTTRYSFPFVSMDYGTANPTAMLLIVWDAKNKRFFVASEFYYDGHNREQIDDSQKYSALERLAEGVPLMGVIVDPSALSFITLVKNKHHFRVFPAENSVVAGIALTQNIINQRKYVVSASCTGLISEMGLYAWDIKASERGEDKPLKTHDHSADALRYHAMTYVAHNLKKFGIAGYFEPSNARRP